MALFRFLLYMILSLTPTVPLASASTPLDPIQLLKEIHQIHRASSSLANMSMTIENPNWTRTMKLKVWSLGTDYTLIRILSPAKDKGISTLRRGIEMWNYFPKINRDMKVPPSMMMGSWMGSDFSNDDLVKQSDLADDYHVQLKTLATKYRLILTPKKSTATVWGRIEILVDQKTKLPLVQSFFDEKGEKIREMVFSEPQIFSGRLVPRKMEMLSLTKKAHKTTIEYQNLDLGVQIDPSFFSLHNLKKAR